MAENAKRYRRDMGVCYKNLFTHRKSTAIMDRKEKPHIVKISSSPTYDVVSTPALNEGRGFVKLIGYPPKNSDEAITNAPFNDSLGDPAKHLLDVLDSENEDPFTLESLRELITMHAEKGLDFIIARVATVDPTDSEKVYFSYYAAHHINKGAYH